MNLYAFLNINSLTHFDEYGLFSVSEQFEKLQPILTNPRFQGAMQAFTGFNEVVAGASISCGSGLLAAPLGFVVMGHGVDHFVQGMKQVITGSYAETATSQVLQKTGLGGQTANLLDNSFSIAGMAKGAAVKQLDQGTFAPKNLTPKVPEKRFQKSPTKDLLLLRNNLTRDNLRDYLSNLKYFEKNRIISDLKSLNLNLKGKSPDGKFMEFQDRFGNTRVKIHPPDKKTPFNHIHIYDKKGNSLNKYLNQVDRRDPSSHIPYGESK